MPSGSREKPTFCRISLKTNAQNDVTSLNDISPYIININVSHERPKRAVIAIGIFASTSSFFPSLHFPSLPFPSLHFTSLSSSSSLPLLHPLHLSLLPLLLTLPPRLSSQNIKTKGPNHAIDFQNFNNMAPTIAFPAPRLRSHRPVKLRQITQNTICRTATYT